MSDFRLVIYTDFSYRASPDGVTAQLPFALFLNELSRRDVDVTVLGRVEEDERPYPFALSPRIRFVGLPGYTSLANPLTVGRAMLRTLQRFAHRTSEADAVWLFGPHPFAFGFAAIAAARGQRVVLGVRQDLPALIARRRKKSPWINWSALLLEKGYRALSRRCATVVVGDDLATAYGSARRLLNLPISLVSKAQIVERATLAERSYDGALTAVSVGRLDPEKNPLMLADVLRELRAEDPRWRLEVYGEGSLADQLADRLAELGLGDHARLCGYLPVDQGLHDVYRRSHALLHVSWTEGVPQILFEAFAAGLPVVATAVGGVAEAAGNAAILVPPGDPAPPARALASLGRDEVLRERLTSAGLAQVADVTLERQAGRAISFVAQAL